MAKKKKGKKKSRADRYASAEDMLLGEIQRLGMNQSELAERIGKHKTHVSALVNGRRPFTAEVAVALEHALGVPAIDWMRLDAERRIAEVRAGS